MSWLDDLRRAAAQSAIRLWLNHRYAPLGSMTQLQIDPATRTIRLQLELKGEASPIHIELREYSLSERDGKTWLRVGRVETSREWLTVLGREWLIDREHEVPDSVRLVL